MVRLQQTTKKSETMVNLFDWTVPPSGIQLLDETGAEILGDVGPFQEETHLLTCDILGGENPPVLLFYVN